MASKKEKYLESAQRFMLKGQLDKAIKDYQQVVALEPKEIRYRQKLAELLVRDSRKEEAIAQYEGIAKHYAENSYFLKAIAVYKQIQRLSPNNTEIVLTIASLNHKQGLIGNALAEYGQVVAQYEKEGLLKEAIKVIEQMLVIDGDQAATRLKHAEILYASGAEDASYEAFSSLARSLKTRGDAAAAQQVAERMGQLFASRQEDDLDAIEARIEAGECEGAINLLHERLKGDRGDLRAWQLLCDAERRSGNSTALRQAYAQMLNLFPDQLDVIEAGIRFHIDSADSRGALSLIERHLPRFLEKGRTQAAESLLLSLSADVAREAKAVEALKRVYQAAGAVDKLDALTQEGESQFRPEQSLFSSQPSQGADAELLSAFGAPAPSDPSAGSGAEPPSPWEAENPASAAVAAPGAAGAPKAAAAPWEEEIDLDLDDDGGSAVAAAGEVELPVDFSLDLDLEEEPSSLPAEESSPFGAPVASEQVPSSFGDLSFFEEAPSPVASAPSAEPAAPQAAASPFEMEISLDEDLSSFAEAGSPPEEAPSPFGGAAASEELSSPFGEAAASEELASPFGPEPSPASAVAPPSSALQAGDTLVEGAGEIPLELDLAEDSSIPDFGWQQGAPLETAVESGEVADDAVMAGAGHPDGLEHAEEIEEVEEVELHDDLADLSNALEELGLAEEPAELPEEAQLQPVPPEEPLRGWEEIFPQNAAGEVVDLGELESHYDLGVGYKEMGMYSKAIQEFELAAGNPQRRLDCLTLQAVCFREKGEPEKAQDLLQRGRELDVLSSEERATICYELGYLYESQGAPREAIELYREVHLSDPTFHDVAERLSALTGEESLDFIDLEEAELQ
ncbi:hypothetical protein [Geomonas sp.]|uniref:hypothetical protein n=1 Tax=Geomonas sp. TaxID=2651584 RepID=UPI002B48FB2E|nr:hypothetical protein [Geomonas sp.]HJV36802.1 hypothetical protein [Geomonas sp.]